jgi:hypothetical protein
VKLPDGLDPFQAAPLYCAGVTMYKALKVSQAQSNNWISIVGVGGLGKFYFLTFIYVRTIFLCRLSRHQVCKNNGFRVIGVVAEKDHVLDLFQLTLFLLKFLFGRLLSIWHLKWELM